MAEPYTPTDDEVRNSFDLSWLRLTGDKDGDLTFDRWLAAHDRQVADRAKVEALRRLVALMRTMKQPGHWNLADPLDFGTAYSPDRWLEVFADRIEAGEQS